MERLENTISSQESELSSLKNKYSALALEYGTNSREARELATKISTLSEELNENRSKLSMVETAANNVEGELREVGDAAGDAADGFSVWKGTLANLASSGIQSALGGIKNLGASMWGLADETRELRTNLAKLDTAFFDTDYSAQEITDTYSNFYAILGDEGQTTEAVSHLAKLTDSQEELSEWTLISTGVYATFGDSLPIENLTEAANETAKTGKLTGGLADALNWAGVNEEEFQKKLDACNTEAEREAGIRKTLTKLYGDAGYAYEAMNGRVMDANKAQAEYNIALANIGKTIEPIKTAFVNGMTSILEAVVNLTRNVDIDAIENKIESAFDYLHNTVFPAIKTGIQWFIDNKDIIIAGIAGIVAGIAAFKVVSIVQTAVGAFKAFQAATVGLTTAQKLLNLAMSANPIGLVVAAITGLVTAFVLLWNNCESFRNFWIGLWDGIKNAASVAWEAIKGFFSGAWEAIKGIWNGAGAFFSGIWNGIKNAFSNVGSWFSEKFTAAKNSVEAAWSNTKQFFSDRWADIKSAFADTKEWFKDTFSKAWENTKSAWSSTKQFFSEKWSDIKTALSPATDWMKEKFTAAWDAVKKAWNKSIVKTYFDQCWTSIKQVFGVVKSFFTGKFGEAWQGIKDIFSGWTSFFSGLWDRIKNTFSSLGTKLGDAIGGAVKNAINKVFGWVESTLNKGIGLINGAIGIINKIPGVNIGKIGALSLPRLASGGVLRAETAFIGGEYPGARNNPEIVTPQSIMRETFADVLNATLDNVLHLDRLAAAIEKLADRPINIDVDGYRLATATAGATDTVSGNRLNLKNRGLAL